MVDDKSSSWDYVLKQTAFGIKITRAKGKVPKMLSGLYTSERTAKIAIEMKNPARAD